MAFCTKGHYYDEAKHKSCPLCKGGQAAPATVYEGDDGPVPAGAQQFPPLKPLGLSPSPRPQPLRPMGVGGVRPAAGAKTVLDDEDEAYERLMGFLVIVSSKQEDEYRYIRLRKGVNRVGRFGARSEVELRDTEVSTEHALIVCTNNASRLVDLDSSNGVFVNGDRREYMELQESDQITFGRTSLVFVPFPFVADD